MHRLDMSASRRMVIGFPKPYTCGSKVDAESTLLVLNRKILARVLFAMQKSGEFVFDFLRAHLCKIVGRKM